MTDKLSDAELISALNRIREGWETEYRFHPSRKWRFDFANPDIMVAVEIEGGLWMSVKGGKSRHFTGTGAKADMEKYNEAQIRGWSILRYPERSKAIIEDVHRFLNPPTEHHQTAIAYDQIRWKSCIHKCRERGDPFCLSCCVEYQPVNENTQRKWSMTETSTVIE